MFLAFPLDVADGGMRLLIGDQASDQDWLLNLPKATDKGAFKLSLPFPVFVLVFEAYAPFQQNAQKYELSLSISSILSFHPTLLSWSLPRPARSLGPIALHPPDLCIEA